MSHSQFNQLQRLRALRLRTATRHLAAARSHFQTATANCDKAQTTLAEYRKLRANRESQLFTAIQGCAVNLQDIDDFNLQLGGLTVTESRHIEAIESALKTCAKADDELGVARQEWLLALRSKDKIDRLCAERAEGDPLGLGPLAR